MLRLQHSFYVNTPGVLRLQHSFYGVLRLQHSFYVNTPGVLRLQHSFYVNTPGVLRLQHSFYVNTPGVLRLQHSFYVNTLGVLRLQHSFYVNTLGVLRLQHFLLHCCWTLILEYSLEKKNQSLWPHLLTMPVSHWLSALSIISLIRAGNLLGNSSLRWSTLSAPVVIGNCVLRYCGADERKEWP